MLNHLRLILAQLIAPSGYEVADFDYAQKMATNCYFRGRYDTCFLIRFFMESNYGTDWRDDIYKFVKNREEHYSSIINEKRLCLMTIGLIESPPFDKRFDLAKRCYSIKGIAPTINCAEGGGLQPKILIEI